MFYLFFFATENIIGQSDSIYIILDSSVIKYDISDINHISFNEISNIRKKEIDKINEILNVFNLHQNYPNTFNPSTTIKYALPFESNVKLIVYNSLGEKVKELVNSQQQAGYQEVIFNGQGLSSGIYFYTLEANSIDGKNNFKDVKKLIFLK